MSSKVCNGCKLNFDDETCGVWVCMKCAKMVQTMIDMRNHSKMHDNNGSSCNDDELLLPKMQPLLKETKSEQILRNDRTFNVNIRHNHTRSLSRSFINGNGIKNSNINSNEYLIHITLYNSKRRFKYCPNTTHKGFDINQIKLKLYNRFHKKNVKETDVDAFTFEINNENNFDRYVLFDNINDIYNGCKVRIWESKCDVGNIIGNSKDERNLNNINNNRDNNDEYFDDNKSIIIVDLGSGIIKGGLSSKLNDKITPDIVLPNAVYKNGFKSSNDDYKDMNGYTSINGGNGIYYGRNAINICEQSKCQYTKPIKNGLINDWEQLMNLLENNIFFNERIIKNNNKHDLSNFCVLLLDGFNNDYNKIKSQRKKLIETFFEDYNCNSIYISHSTTMSLYGAGRTKGIIVDCGDETTNIISTNSNGFNRNNANNFSKNIGSYSINLKLKNVLNMKYNFNTINNIKETVCYCPMDNDDFNSKYNEINYILPDKSILKLNKNQRLTIPLTTYFNSNYNDINGINVVDLVIKNLMRNDENTHDIDVLSKNIILCGGGTLLNGFCERFAYDIKNELKNIKTKVHAGRNRQYLGYSGANIMSNITTFNKMFTISKKLYLEHGNKIVNSFKR